MHGLVLDYDAIGGADPELMVMANAPADLRPARLSRTFSGNCRVYYVFEHPVPLYCNEINKAFLTKVSRELKLKKLLPGFELEALLDVSKPYEVGTEFRLIGDGTATIPFNLLMGWMVSVSNKHKWSKEGPKIPIEAIREAARIRFGEAAWPGGWEVFDIGARGRRFWDESAVDSTAVIVRVSGCQYFSEGGGFHSWEQIFGTDFVRKWRDSSIGEAVKDIWFDGTLYWMQELDQTWKSKTDSNIRLHLNVEHRLSAKSCEGAPSEVSEALHAIQKLQRVTAAMPFIYQVGGPLDYNGATYLNISNIKPVTPIAELVQSDEGFPWISQFLLSLFDPVDQLDYFLTWLKHFYMGAVNHSPRRGLALFLAGPVGTGKTMLSKAIISRLAGGCQDAGLYLLQNDKFNDGLFKAAVWTIDDEVISNDPKQRAKFTQAVKKIVANDSFTYRAMFRSGDDMEWIGRVIVTMNDDPESLQMLPETDRNILDKIMLLKVKAPSVDSWPTDEELDAELPYFGAFLRDVEIPDKCKGTERFGVAPFLHPALLEAAAGTSETATFEDLLMMWRSEWFASGGVGAADLNWTGKATDLLTAICRNDSLYPIVQGNFRTARSIGIHLNKLLKQVPVCPFLHNPSARIYTISKP